MAQKVKETNVSREDLIKEKEDVEGLKTHLEEEYRKANISEKNYSELKDKHEKRLKEINKKLEAAEKKEKPKEKKKQKSKKKEVEKEPDEKTEEVKPAPETEVEAAEVPSTESEKETVVKKDKKTPKKKSGGLFSKLLKHVPKLPQKKETEKKEEGKTPEEEKSEEENLIEQAALAVGSEQEGAAAMIEGAENKMQQLSETQEAEASVEGETAPGRTNADMEIEKMKVMIDTIRDTKTATDETIRAITENIGELRSMVFQSDGSLRTITTDMEKLEDEIGEMKPKEIDKKFRELNTILEKQQLILEKLTRKSEDLAEKTNKAYNMLKGAGGIENMVTLNSDIKQKIKDIKDIIKYVERIAFKTEKVFIDLNKNMEDFILFKSKQEDIENSVKELTKSVDKVALDLENYSTKKEFEELRGDIISLGKEFTQINNALPILQTKLPDPITGLMKDREDIIMFLETLEENFKNKSINKEEYEEARKKNLEKLKIIKKEMRREWDRLEEYTKQVAAGATPEPEVEEEPKAKAEGEKLPEEKTEEVKPAPETEVEAAEVPSTESEKEKTVGEKRETEESGVEEVKEEKPKEEDKTEEGKVEEKDSKTGEKEEKAKKPKGKKEKVEVKSEEDAIVKTEEEEPKTKEKKKDKKPDEKKEEENSEEDDEEVSNLLKKIRGKMKDL